MLMAHPSLGALDKPGEGSSVVAVWDRLGGFYQQLPSGFFHLCHDATAEGNTGPCPGGMLTLRVHLPSPGCS